MSLRELGCNARQATEGVVYPTPWGPPDDYYKVNPGHVMELYLPTGTIYVGVGFETDVQKWGAFTFAGEPA